MIDISNINNYYLISFAITISFIIIIVIVFAIISKIKKKKKYDLHNLKKLCYDSGTKLLEAYKNIKELENAFIEIERIGK